MIYLSRMQSMFVCIGLFVLFVTFGFSVLPAHAVQEGDTLTFKVTGYYSPLPGQSRYSTGSYAGDLRLNGNGTHGADGTAVYVGMISAPSPYPFETKIYIEGMGVGTVHDRGGAINGNRLDIWMGTGDDGLTRALNWGSRTVSGKIMPAGTPNSFTFGISTSPTPMVYVTPEPIIIPDVFNTSFQKNDTGEGVEKIQKFLQYEGFIRTSEFGVYNSKMHNAVYRFQKSYGIVSSKKDEGAGIWGPKTREVANEVLYTRNKELEDFPSFTENLWYGKTQDPSDEIRTLQRFLAKNGYYSGSVSGKYSFMVQYAVFNFQKDNLILDSIDDYGAGAWGPKTRSVANSL